MACIYLDRLNPGCDLGLPCNPYFLAFSGITLATLAQLDFGLTRSNEEIR